MKRFQSFAFAAVFVVSFVSTARAQFIPSGGTTAAQQRNTFSFRQGEDMGVSVSGDSITATVAPKNPTRGPTDIFVYQNDKGTWKISTIDPANPTRPTGTANYRWDNERHKDELIYLGFGDVVENDGNYIPIGSKVPVWAYLAYDKDGNEIYFYLGVSEIRPSPRPGRKVYPMYYSHRPPGVGTPKRVLTDSGTSRK